MQWHFRLSGPDHAGWFLQSRRLAVSLNTTFVSVIAGRKSKSQMRIIKKRGRVCGGEDRRVSRMHNKHRAMERVAGRERKRERHNATHVQSYTWISRVWGRLSSRWLQIPLHDDRRKVETLEYHHLSQQWCRPQAGFMPLSLSRYCKLCTLVPGVPALQKTV